MSSRGTRRGMWSFPSRSRRAGSLPRPPAQQATLGVLETMTQAAITVRLRRGDVRTVMAKVFHLGPSAAPLHSSKR